MPDTGVRSRSGATSSHGLISRRDVVAAAPRSIWLRRQLQSDQGGPERNHPDLGHSQVIRDHRGVCSEVVGRLTRQDANVHPHQCPATTEITCRTWKTWPTATLKSVWLSPHPARMSCTRQANR